MTVGSGRLDGFAQNFELHFSALWLSQEETVFFDAAVHIFTRGKTRLFRVVCGFVDSRANLHLVDDFALNGVRGQILAGVERQHPAVLISMTSGERGRRGNRSE